MFDNDDKMNFDVYNALKWKKDAIKERNFNDLKKRNHSLDNIYKEKVTKEFQSLNLPVYPKSPRAPQPYYLNQDYDSPLEGRGKKKIFPYTNDLNPITGQDKVYADLVDLVPRDEDMKIYPK